MSRLIPEIFLFGQGRHRFLPLALLLFVALALSGCGTLQGVGQIGPDLKPTLGASVSMPLGK